MTHDEQSLRLVNDAPSMVVVLEALTQAQAVLATHTLLPRDAEDTVRKMQAILDDRKVVAAVDTLLPDDRARWVKRL
jgi:hypothetical protein